MCPFTEPRPFGRPHELAFYSVLDWGEPMLVTLPKPWALIVFLILWSGAWAQEFDLGPIEVRPEPGQLFRRSGTNEQKIYSGKKNTQIAVAEKGPMAGNNYRQLATEVPGLSVSEVNNESFSSLSYRGLGDPHESFHLMTLENDVPISADLYGYPAVYYQVPMDSVERIEFLRGGAALWYGPQSGAALQFITRKPSSRPWGGRVRFLGGDFSYQQSFAELSGTQGDQQYQVQHFQRGGRGFRDSNSDYRIDGGNLYLRQQWNPQWSADLRLQIYQGDHGEAGGLAKEAGVDAIPLSNSRTATTSPNDRLEISRQALIFGLNYERDNSHSWQLRAWYSDMARDSFRQNYASGQAVFGTLKNGTSNDIVEQDFLTQAIEWRGQSKQQWGSMPTQWTYGLRFYDNDNPLQQSRGSSANARSGARLLEIHRDSQSQAAFTEWEIQWQNWVLVPGLRFEKITQRLQENFRASADPLRVAQLNNEVLLYGFGLERRLGQSRWKFVGNSSTGFTPPLFSEAFPLSPADQINQSLQAAHTQSHELGLVGEMGRSMSGEFSVFHMRNANQVGRVGNEFLNVGRAEYQGLEALFVVDLLREWSASRHSLQMRLAYSYLEAEFMAGAQQGRRPQYSPQNSWRWSLSYLNPSDWSLNLSGQYLSEHFADDANSQNFKIPAYSVWDLAAQIPVHRNTQLELAIRNLWQQDYFSRIRSNGIEPGAPRTLQAGVNLVF